MNDQTNEIYAEVYRLYASDIKAVLLKRGLPQEQLDDLAQDIIVKMMERDYLSKFDPNYELVDDEGVVHKTSLKAFVTGFTAKYALAMRDTFKTRSKKEPNSTRIEARAPGAPDLAIVSNQELNANVELIDAIQHAIEEIKKRPVRGRRDLATLLLITAIQAISSTDGRPSREEMTQIMQMSATALHLATRELRDVLDTMKDEEGMTASEAITGVRPERRTRPRAG